MILLIHKVIGTCRGGGTLVGKGAPAPTPTPLPLPQIFLMGKYVCMYYYRDKKNSFVPP